MSTGLLGWCVLRGAARAGFGRLAAEFGVRHDDAVHQWALWALDQITGDTPGRVRSPQPPRVGVGLTAR